MPQNGTVSTYRPVQTHGLYRNGEFFDLRIQQLRKIEVSVCSTRFPVPGLHITKSSLLMDLSPPDVPIKKVLTVQVAPVKS